PTHIIATVNVSFGIWDKEGNLIKIINPDTWFQNVLDQPDVFDPQVMYDHFDKKWIMVWDSWDGTSRANLLVAVSDDSIPLGNWYTWSLPANQNGNTVVDNWSDYPQIGFDKNAIYINCRQFGFPGNDGLKYNKIRIIKKSDIYNNPGGALSWSDIWDISSPSTPKEKPDVIIPAITYGTEDTHYFLHAPRYGGNYITLYKIINPTTAPVLSGVNIPVQFYSEAPNSNQKGGSTTLISSNESGMKSAPIYRDGYLYGVHSIANPSSTVNSAIRYYKIDVTSSTVTESATLGAPGYWYLFPNLTVDKYHNIAINYSRSGNDEYCGAYYTTRLKDDPPGLSGSKVLQEGKGNYVVTFSATRNRWGDYHGIFLDPTNETNVWMFTEFAANTNIWGTWIGEIRMIPFVGAYTHTLQDSLDFNEWEINEPSNLLTVTLANLGNDTLVITDIPAQFGVFRLNSTLTFPVKLATYDSLTLDFSFLSQAVGEFNSIYPITSNDPNFAGIKVSGSAYQIVPAIDNVIYASSGTGNDGKLLSINPSNGNGNNIGLSKFSEITDIAIHPKTKVIYAITPSGFNTNFLRVNSLEGDAHVIFESSLQEAKSIAFDSSGTLYTLLKNGRIHTVDLETGNSTLVMDTSFTLAGIAFNPVNNELWATTGSLFANKDRVMKLDLSIPDTTIVGKTGLNTVTNNIAFDKTGVLYGITGNSSQLSNLIKINTATAAGTVIGSTGFKHVTGIDLTSNSVTSNNEERTTANLPSDYVLEQNYPNPFNPSTTIRFALPITSNVQIRVFNLLGQTIKTLYDGVKNAGYHTVQWNSDDQNNKAVSSGIYFYEMNAMGVNGQQSKQMKKMILIK
ncbi:MAG: T9SS type A sorting domain-containing protein, partial [Ignavibacteriaceae bacterium]|nr:T9SS type A sorting domain-containing protein [Ignavibacteriaceae bacterium]